MARPGHARGVRVPQPARPARVPRVHRLGAAHGAEIEDEFGTAEWTPLLLQVDDDFPRSLAAYRLADVLIVNPLRDGMNLVAKEVPVVSERGCALVLSREAGAYYDLGDDAIVINPYDISATAEALHEALMMDEDERLRALQATGGGVDRAAAAALVRRPAGALRTKDPPT